MTIAAVVLTASLASCGPTTEPSGAGGPHQVLHRGLGGEPVTLDPVLASDNAALFLLQDLFEGLTTEAPDGHIVPGAAAYWTTSADQRRWTFHLRPNLRWSDGKPLSAADFVAGLEAVRAPATEAPYAGLLAPVRSTLAPDPMTVVIELAEPAPHLPSLLAMPFASPRRADTTTAVLVSNGPYAVRARRPGEKIELERNPHYHAAGSVAIERVSYLTLEDLNTELNLYRSGALDITSEVPNSQVGWLRQNRPGELHIAPYLSTYGYAINLARVPDRDARMALAMAVDRRQITGQVTGAGERPAYGWVPAGIPGYAPAQFSWAAFPGVERTAQARQLWGVAHGRHAAPDHLRLCTDASANHRRTAVALVDQWRRALDVEVTIVEMEWKAYLAMRERPGDCDLVRFGWSADFVDPEAFLTLFTSGHAQNVAGYSNPAYDALLAKAGLVADAGQRATLLADAERILLQDAVVIPIFQRVSKRLVKPGIDGIAANPLGHLPSRHLRLRKAAEEK
jgi:oligopeptide transport system substrate-binding protein